MKIALFLALALVLSPSARSAEHLLESPVALPVAPPVCVPESAYACVLNLYQLTAKDKAFQTYLPATPAGVNLRKLLILNAFGSSNSNAGLLFKAALAGINTDSNATFEAIQYATARVPAASYPAEAAMLDQIVNRLNFRPVARASYFLSVMRQSAPRGANANLELARKLYAFEQAEATGAVDEVELERSVAVALDSPVLVSNRAALLQRYSRTRPVAATRLGNDRGIRIQARRPIRIPRTLPPTIPPTVPRINSSF